LLPTTKTNVCRKQHENLEIAFEIACDHGLIDHHIPHREYNSNRKQINDIYNNLHENDLVTN